MIYISAFEIFYSLIDVYIEPIVTSHETAFAVLSRFENSLFNRPTCFYLVTVWCGCFGFSVACFGVHFVYRYGAVHEEFRQRFISGKKVSAIFLTPLIYFGWWTTICIVFFKYTPASDEFLRSAIMVQYEYPIEQLSYIVVNFFNEDENGTLHPDLQIFSAMGCAWFMTITSMFCVFYFGSKCYLHISTALSVTTTQSKVTKSLQQQLFQALVVQTLIPVLLMFIPVFILFFFPMFNIDVGFPSNFIAGTTALYPAIDPLPNMFIIRAYRKAIISLFSKLSMQIVRPCVSKVDQNCRRNLD